MKNNKKRNEDMRSLGERYGTDFSVFVNRQAEKIRTWFNKFNPTKRITILFAILAALLLINLLLLV